MAILITISTNINDLIMRRLRASRLSFLDDSSSTFSIIGALSCLVATINFATLAKFNDVVDFDSLGDFLFVGSEKVEAMLIDVVHTFEFGSDVDGP